MPSDIEQRRRRQKREAVQGVLLFAALRLAGVIVLLWSISLVPEFPWLLASLENGLDFRQELTSRISIPLIPMIRNLLHRRQCPRFRSMMLCF